MTSDFVRRQVNELLQEAALAIRAADWSTVKTRAEAVLTLDPGNPDGAALVEAAQRALGGVTTERTEEERKEQPSALSATSAANPTSFANGRYTVKRFLGEGGKKRVYLAHDTTLARDVAFALIKTDGLDSDGRERITREAQAMGKLGTHPHVVSVFDMGSEGESPYLVTELMQGGDIEGLLEKAPEHRLTIPDAVSLAVQVCRGLEFAHSHGLVHRDLKPGNVWLTADGTPKIGDFGLAVSLDRSRLTRAGMMVGTVSYMPPEQAMGGEVSPRSDLYSLGAMLYEMVTGRPPFVGEESVAIITQHLNVPPVSPTWHRPDCPPGLEALILRLLEKDAAKRPGSAGEVRQALDNLAALGPKSNVQGPTSNVQGDGGSDLGPGTLGLGLRADNPLYRRTFVGREQELRQLQATFDGAVSGNGALVMVVGEPGIGKTALCEQLATYVTVRGGKALVGHCYEEGSLSLPYLPFVEAIRSHVLDREPEKLRSELGSAATDVARIVSEVRDRVQVEPHASVDPEDDRWRLYQAVTAFLRNVSTAQPLFILLEDLHWADRGTLDLLVHLGRNLQGMRLVLVGTYRDVEVDRTHPLSGTIAELRRGSSFARIPLRGLTGDEVHRMLRALTGQEVRWSLAEAVHRQTEGNPLFTQEVLRYLVEEGLLGTQDGRYRRAGDDAPEMRIPEGLRDVIGKRLSRLSPECNRVLALASVIGRDFTLSTLQAISNLEGEALIAALEEATRVGVLEERAKVGGAQYRFSHAFFRQTLYEEMSVPRRLQQHQQVARVLEEQYGGHLADHAAELADHFSHSSDKADLTKAVAYGEMAAQRAMKVYAYGEAVRLLSQALEVQEVVDPEDRGKRCDLLIGLAGALLPAGEAQRVAEEVAPEVFRLAEALEDPARASRACEFAMDGLVRHGGTALWGSSVFREWQERLDRWAPPESEARVRAELARSHVLQRGGDYAGAREVQRRAVELARRLSSPGALSYVAVIILQDRPPAGYSEALAFAEEYCSHPHTGVLADVGRATWYAGNIFLSCGRREDAEARWAETLRLASGSREATLTLFAARSEPMLRTVDGQLEDAMAAAEGLVALGNAVGLPGRGRQFAWLAMHRAAIYLGKMDRLLPFFPGEPDLNSDPVDAVLRSLALAHVGRISEAAEILSASFGRPLRDIEQTWSVFLVELLEAAILIGEAGAVRRLADALTPAAWLATTEFALTCPARHLGAAASFLGDPDRARAFFQQGLQACQAVGFRPEIALIHLDLARLLLEHYPEEQAEALGHLDYAIGEFREMKMQPALERALKHKGLLHA